MRGFAIMVMSALALAGCKKAADKPAMPDHVQAHDIKQLMALVVQPQADTFWRSAGTVTDASGTHSLLPTTPEAWLKVRSAAATVTEMGNLLMTKQYSEGRGDDWMQFSRSLVEIGLKMEKAAADKNEDEIFETGGTLYNVCSACHQVYPPKAGEIPKAADNAVKAQNAS